MIVSQGGCSEYLATANFVREVYNFCSSSIGGMYVDSGKTVKNSYWITGKVPVAMIDVSIIRQ